jgi:KaiC domain protein
VSGTDDEDWFEKALRQSESDDDASDTSAADTGDTDAEGTVEGDTEEAADGDDTEQTPFDGGSDTDGESGGGQPADGAFGGDHDADDPGGDPFGGESAANDEDPFGGESAANDEDPFGGGADTGDSDAPFGGNDGAEQDAFGGESDTGGDSPFGGGESSDPFGGVRSSEQPQSNGGGGDPFGSGGDTEQDPFGGARSSPGGDGDTPFGEGFDEAMGGGMGDEGPEFDEEEFESEIERIDVGIEGLDDMILGGVPIRSLMTVIGGAGTGKTTFGLQFLNRTMQSGGSGVYITLEETEEAIISTAEEKGWPFEQYVDDDQLIVVAMDPIEMANSLDSIRGDISRLVNEFGADRLVLDSVSLLEMMYDHPAKRRSEVFDFARSLKRAGVTTMLTSEANADNSYQSRHGLVEYLVDAVFVLQYVRPNDFQETRLAVEIQKIRDANHSRETKPYDITDEGISVYRQANIF